MSHHPKAPWGGGGCSYSHEFLTWTLDDDGWLQAWATPPPEKKTSGTLGESQPSSGRATETERQFLGRSARGQVTVPTVITRIPLLCFMQTTNFARVLSYNSPQAVHISDEKLEEFSLRAVQAFKSHLCKEDHLLSFSSEVTHLLYIPILTHKLSLRSTAQGRHYFTHRFMLTYNFISLHSGITWVGNTWERILGNIYTEPQSVQERIIHSYITLLLQKEIWNLQQIYGRTIELFKVNFHVTSSTGAPCVRPKKFKTKCMT
jgi:hypothetical protein